MISILSHTAASYSEEIAAKMGNKGRHHAKLIYKTFFRTAQLYQEEGNAKKLIEDILALTDFSLPEIVDSFGEEKTRKVILKASDDNLYEMVIIPMQAGWTLCLSSQVGCKIGCAFCETGKMGLIRSLTVEEIVGQLLIARHKFNVPIRNLVFMGMGEPFDNYEAVMRAVEVFTDMSGGGIGYSHITISTSGLVDKILRFSREAHPALNLALSINAPTTLKRVKLMPITKTYDLEALRSAMEVYLQHPRREILIEYVLINDRNDSLADADSLIAYLKGLRVRVNLIPYNPQRRGCFKAPDKETVDVFFSRLKEAGLPVLMRHTKGDTIMAACGQLGKKSHLR